MSRPKNNLGTSLGGRLEESPARKRRRARARKREDQRWAARSGPVEVRQAEPRSVEQDDDTDQD